MSKVSALLSRLAHEEGMRLFPYDDATGKRVGAPLGNLSWGYGFNLDQCGSSGLFEVMETYLVTQLDRQLAEYPWYVALDDVRGSVPLDVAYNAGLNGLLKGFPHFISALERGDIDAAVVQLHVADPHLDASRYAPLRSILLTGVNPS